MPDLPKGFKAVGVQPLPEGFQAVGQAPLPQGQDLANLPPEVAARVQAHRDILARQAQGGWAPMGPGAVPSPGQQYSPEVAAQVIEQTAANAPGAAMMAAGGPALQAAGQVPGMVGAAGRFLMTPLGDAALAGGEELIRTGNPGRAATAAVGAGVTGRVLGGGGGRGIVGRGVRSVRDMMRRGGGEAVEAAAPAVARAAYPVPAPAPVPMPAQAGNVVSMRTPRAMMQAGTPPGPVAAPPVVAPRPGTPASMMRRPEAHVVGRASTPDELNDLMRLSEKLQNAPKQLQDMAGDVVRWSRAELSASTPSGSPGQVATALYDKYGRQVEGLTKHQAQKFVDEIMGALK